jgi:cytosine/adenosine deaminase-related metal-dependent hydrolase
MCRLCDPKKPDVACPTRRDFLKTTAIGGAVAATGATLPQSVRAQAAAATLPEGLGQPGRRAVIRGGSILSMDDAVGNFAIGDVLLDGPRIAAVGASIDAGDATVIDAAGMIVMPGFVDTHHHQFETALRSALSHGILINDGRPVNASNYYETILQKFSNAYRPEDVYISELFGGIAQLDAGVTTVLDVSQIHHSPEHSDAAIEGLRDAGRRGVFG